MPPNSLLGPSEGNWELNSTTSGSKNSCEVLRDQEGITKCLASGGAPAGIPSLHLLETAASPPAFGELSPSLFSVIPWEASLGAFDLIYINEIHVPKHLILKGYTQGWKEVAAGSSQGQALHSGSQA